MGFPPGGKLGNGYLLRKTEKWRDFHRPAVPIPGRPCISGSYLCFSFIVSPCFAFYFQGKSEQRRSPDLLTFISFFTGLAEGEKRALWPTDPAKEKSLMKYGRVRGESLSGEKVLGTPLVLAFSGGGAAPFGDTAEKEKRDWAV